MLRLFEYNNTTDCIAELNLASDVRILQEINGGYALSFTYPVDQKAKELRVNRIIECAGQLFRIEKTEKVFSGTTVINVDAEHIFVCDSKKIHLQTVPDFIGASPYAVLQYAFSGTGFVLLSDAQLSELGLLRVDHDGFLIDFFAMDKTTPYDVLQTVIENCGKGEIYIDNYNIALVERIGMDTDIELKLSQNMEDITIERDITDMVTRLYPYGNDDMHIGSVNSGVQYIESPNIGIYGIKEGYRDYSDYKEPQDILAHAMWEFSVDNAERIDVPQINISGTFADLSGAFGCGIEKIALGDSVIIKDGDITITERIISIERYPYEAQKGSVSIGRIKKDLFFYLNQMGKVQKSYKKNTTNSGALKGSSVSGIIRAEGVSINTSDSSVPAMSQLIVINDASGEKFRCGIDNGAFAFSVRDSSGQALFISAGAMHIRGAVEASSLSIAGVPITVNGSDVYLNGKKILVQE